MSICCDTRRIRLLLAEPVLFRTARESLESHGFTVLEHFDEEESGEDAVIFDDFFARAGAEDHFRRFSSAPLLLAVDRGQPGPSFAVRHTVDEYLVLPAGWRRSPRLGFLEAMDRSRILNLLGSTEPEFGSGLWAAIMDGVHQTAVSGSAFSACA